MLYVVGSSCDEQDKEFLARVSALQSLIIVADVR